MSHILLTKSLPREIKRSKQKVQFAEFQELDFRKTKQLDKGQENNHSVGHEVNGRLGPHTSSLTTLHKESSHRKSSSGRQTYSLERQTSRNASSSRTSPTHRRQSESLTRSRADSNSSSASELTRTHSLDKKHFHKLSKVDEPRNSRSSIELRQENRERRSLKKFEDRSQSMEEESLIEREKNEQLILTQNGMNKHAGHGSNIFKDHPFNKSLGECSQRLRRAVSRSPKQRFNKENNEEFDKENERLKDVNERKKKTPMSPERQSRAQLNKKGNKNDMSANGKINKQEHFWKFEKDVMWVYNSSGGKRAGYLLFTCAYMDQQPKDLLAKKYGMTFKFSQADSKLIRILLEAHGFKEVNSTSSYFNLYWGNVHFSPNELRQLQDWQKINHFPRSSELTRKDRLYMNIKRMQRQFGVKLFDFIPTSFVLPTEHREFCDTHLRERGIWIVKPVASSQGKGIYLVSQVDQVPADETSLVCRYLDSPLLVDGFKCDLRLYVVVTSLDPLIVYLYEEGLVRLATIKYQLGKNLWNPCIHLTNYSVNKFHSNYVQNEDPEVDDRGNKWSLSAFLRHLKARGIDTGSLMRAIEDVIIKSILSASYQMNTATNMFVPHSRNCFELYGFDILIDNQLKPWVLEVNLSPSLNMDQPLDLKIKSAMLADLFSLVGIQVCNPSTSKVSTRPSIYRKLPNLRHSAESFDRLQPGISRYGLSLPNGLVPGPEELRLFRQLREEYERRGGWARIFPTPDSWAMYGGLQEYDSHLNLTFHLHLYPNIPRNNKCFRGAPLKVSSVSSSGLASSLERLNCYERALPKTKTFLKNKFSWETKKKQEKKVTKDVGQVKASLVNALESGISLSKYQARMAFSAYLQHVQRRLMIGCDRERQTDLVFRFLRSASRTLHLPFNVQAPARSLPQEARAVVISKQLGDFIQAYTRETHLYLDRAASASCASLSSQCPSYPSVPPTPSEPSAPPQPKEEGTKEDPPPPSSSFPSSVSLLSVNSLPDYYSYSSPSPASSSSNSSSSNSVARPPLPPAAPSMDTLSPSSLLRRHPPNMSSSTPSSFSSTPAINEGGRVEEASPSPLISGRLLRFRSDGDSGICSADDEGNSKEEAACSSQVNDKEKLRRMSSDQEEGIAMELYRDFLSNAREADLEEVLSLHTRIHNSAGMFLDPARKSRSQQSSSSSLSAAAGSGQTAGTASRPRTPTASPHGSPRRVRRSASDKGGSSSSQEEPVTNEPQSLSQPESTPAKEMKRSLSGTSHSLLAASSSTCCLFGNILKASLKGTKTTF